MTTATLQRREVMMQDTAGRGGYPTEFRIYVLKEHARIGNARRQVDTHVFTGVQLHGSNADMAAWNVPNPSTHFTPSFVRFLENGIKGMREAPDREEQDRRWVRVESRILELGQRDAEAVAVLRYYMEPGYMRVVSEARRAGDDGLTVAGLRSRCDRALRQVFFMLGGAW